MRESISASFPLVHIHAFHPRPAAAGAPYAAAAPQAPQTAAQRPAPRRPAEGVPALARLAFLGRPGVGLAALVLLFGGTGLLGFVQSGGYDALIEREGAPWDIAARTAGFDIASVTITGQSRLTETELLTASGVTARQSLPFLDANEVRERLMATPLVKSARVMKLYPNRLVIAVEERVPHALWQQAGRVSVISEDGVVIDRLRDQRYLGLPFVVGEGAQKRLPEFLALVAGLGDLAPRIKAGVMIAGRRWDIEMTNGVMIRLPEDNPGAAVATLLRLQKEARVLDKDVMSIDLRGNDRVVVRLTEEAAAAREAGLAHKTKKSGG